MNILCVNSSGVCLRDRDGSVMSRILGPQILTDDALPRTKCLPEYVSCDELARIGRILLNKLMGTTGRAQNIELSRNDVVSMAVFCIGYFEYIRSADCSMAF
jgi:hypothetical protein